MTEGRLRLCEKAEYLPKELPAQFDPVAVSAVSLRQMRRQVSDVAGQAGFSVECQVDLQTVVHEASMNALRHASEGTTRVHADVEKGVVQVWVRDKGEGIAEHLIHRAMESGWTAEGFGQGLHLMWQTCDRLYMLTESTGTTIVVEMNREPLPPVWVQASDR
jgi:anti-sigma regulatory factor (Ser/Thr protein kinase)